MTQGIVTFPSTIPVGLFQTISQAGYQMAATQAGFIASDAAAVQSIIDSYSGSASELSYHQQQKLIALETQYAAVIAAGRFYSVSGGTDSSQHLYQIDDVPPFSNGVPTRRDSQSTISTMGAWAANVINNVPNTASWPTSFAWQDANNNPVPMTAAECYDFSQNVAAYVSAVDLNYFTLRATINAQTTAAATDAIDVTQGWPTNP